jgi:hypothetical protein
MKRRHRQHRQVDPKSLLIMPRLAEAVGFCSGFDARHLDSYLPFLERMRAEGARVLLKIDGFRKPADAGPYTAAASGGPLGDRGIRMDSDNFADAVAWVVIEYARSCWGFEG